MNPSTDISDSRIFRARSLPVNLYSGDGALGSLPNELARAGVQRAVIVCGRSVHEKTELTRQISDIIGVRLAGIFPAITEGAPSSCIEAAAEYARSVDADGIIAVGAGSVLKGARVISMLLGENEALEKMATQYDGDRKPIATRLMRPKPPIFNVLTAATTAQNRAGSALRHFGDKHQLEFYDPKTRPRAIFWDPVALATAPATLVSSTGIEVYFFALMGTGSASRANVLVKASRAQAWALARDSMARVGGPEDVGARQDLCAAAYLQNRDEDDGGQPLKTHLVGRAAYALSVAVFNRCDGLTQSHGYAAFAGAAIRMFGSLCLEQVRDIGVALGVDVTDLDGEGLTRAVADEVDRAFHRFGWATELPLSNISSDEAAELVNFAVRNYNANSDGALTPHRDRLAGMLDLVGASATVS